MAIGDSYATAAEYRTATGMTDTTQDTAILNNLKSISRVIEAKLGRFFNKDVSAVARLYFREALKKADVLYVDDLVSVTTIKIDKDNDGSFADETALVAADFELHPLNALQGPEARPYTEIWTTPWGAEGTWASGLRIQVTGVFGWPAVPQAIKDATIQLGALLRIETPRATRRIPELGEAIEASREAQSIVKDLMRAYGHPRVRLFA